MSYYFIIITWIGWHASECDTTTSFQLFSEHQPPYIIAVLPRYVEIRTFEPRLLVQSVELQRPRFISSAGWASPVWFCHLSITLFVLWINHCKGSLWLFVCCHLGIQHYCIWGKESCSSYCNTAGIYLQARSLNGGLFWRLPLVPMLKILTIISCIICCFHQISWFSWLWYWCQYLLTKKNTFVSTISLSCFPLLSFTGQILCMSPATTLCGAWCPFQ